MTATITEELKRQSVQGLLSALGDLGWPVAMVYTWPRGHIIRFSGSNRPEIRTEGYSIVEALQKALKSAERFAAHIKNHVDCSCTDRTCEYCPKEDAPAHG